MMRKKRAFDLEGLREALKDPRVHLAVGKITRVDLLDDRSKHRCLVMVWPEEYEVIAETTFDIGGPDAGMYQLPVVDDLVIIGFTTPDDAYILRRLSSKVDTIPAQAEAGNTVLSSLAGKSTYVQSDTAGYLGKGTATDPTEPLVLGNVMISFMETVLEKIDDLATTTATAIEDLYTGPVGIGNLGGPVPMTAALIAKMTLHKTAIDTMKTQLTSAGTQYLDTAATNIVSQLWFTERGD